MNGSRSFLWQRPCLRQNRSPMGCGFYQLRGQDSNLQPPGYEQQPTFRNLWP
jgi:hypothetical protein